MDPFGAELNRLLVETYRSAGKIEEIMLRELSEGKLSIAEMRAIECVGRNRREGSTVKQISGELDITPPSVTVMMKRLEKRGYVEKRKDGEDGRNVHLYLTDDGMHAYIGYRFFHRKMINALREDVKQDEMDVLLRAVRGINEFFRQKLAELEGRAPDEEE